MIKYNFICFIYFTRSFLINVTPSIIIIFSINLYVMENIKIQDKRKIVTRPYGAKNLLISYHATLQ